MGEDVLIRNSFPGRISEQPVRIRTISDHEANSKLGMQFRKKPLRLGKAAGWCLCTSALRIPFCIKAARGPHVVLILVPLIHNVDSTSKLPLSS